MEEDAGPMRSVLKELLKTISNITCNQKTNNQKVLVIGE